jgi:histidinol-phosphate aminotransferase
MPTLLDPVSRRRFLRLSTMAAAAVPVLTEGHLARAAEYEAQSARDQTTGVTSAQAAVHRPRQPTPAGAVLLNANENPLGPCAAACQAIAAIAPKGGRYDMLGETGKLTTTFAKQSGLKEEYVAVYAGSSEPLHFSVMANTSPKRGYVTADPSYEAGMSAARAAGAPISLVPLRADHAHDVKKMVSVDPTAGLIYICNPNNPTGTLTPRKDIEWALENKPKGSILLVDEAYIHLSSAPTVLDLVAANGDLVVLRTFSKVYGMAGIRCGIAAGRPDLLARMMPYGMNAMPITGSAAANVSLLDADLIPTRKKYIADSRNQTFAFLTTNGYKFIPSESNCFMIDTGRDGKQVIAALREKNVIIGRTWPIWPTFVRVSVGTPQEMAAFETAFHQVMSAPATA